MNKNWLNFFASHKTDEILNELKPHIAVLQNIGGSTEKEFLSIGEKLQDFHQRANEISNTASEIAGKTSGREMDNVREGFSRISSVVENMSGSMRVEKETVHIILDHFNQLQQPLVEFEHVIRILNVLCNFIKIEIARLGLSDTSFQKLSEDIGRIAGLIGGKIISLTDQASSAVAALNDNISLIENCDARQNIQGKMILDKIAANLSAISEKHNDSSQTISDISETWRRISLHVGEVVQSLQFHDITRQRVEHVRDALDDLPQKLNTLKKGKRSLSFQTLFKNRYGKSKETSYDGCRPADLIADTFNLQAAQLQGADLDLTEAVKRILRNLGDVAKDAAAISEKIISVTGQDGDRKDSFVVQLEKDINDLADSASDVERIKKELAAAMIALSQTAMGMSVFVKDMEIIGIEMQRLALNARVHAAHIGEQGATLGVLAESIHQLSLNTSSMVQKITSDLQAVLGNAAKLADMAGAESSGPLAQVHEDFVSMLSPLKKIESEISSLLPYIEQSGVLLANDIEHFLAGIEIHKRISSALAKVGSYLSTSAGKMITHQKKRTVDEKTELIEDLSAKYTMHSERETHIASMGVRVEKTTPVIAASQLKNDPPAIQTTKNDNGDDLGDNVELF